VLKEKNTASAKNNMNEDTELIFGLSEIKKRAELFCPQHDTVLSVNVFVQKFYLFSEFVFKVF
jgi:hypothetical protein